MERQMFCFQCQETAGCKGCTMVGVCGKKPDVAAMQDLLVYVSKGISAVTTALRKEGQTVAPEINHLITLNLFVTITNANFDKESIEARIRATLDAKQELLARLKDTAGLPEAALWDGAGDWEEKAKTVGVLSTENEDIRSLRELITYGLKGLSAYSKHANALLQDDEEVDAFLQRALAATLDDSLSADDLVALTLETGKYGVSGMALLDKANTTGLRQSRDHPGEHRGREEPRHPGFRPRPAGSGDAAGADPGHRRGCLHPLRDAARPLLPGFQEVPQLCGQLRQRLVEAEGGV